MNNPLVAQQQPLPPAQDAETQALLERLRQVRMSKEAKIAQRLQMNTRATPVPDSILQEQIPTFQDMYVSDAFQMPVKDFEKTDETSVLGGGPSYDELQSEYSYNPLVQLQHHYSMPIDGMVPDMDKVLGAVLTERLIGVPGLSQTSAYKQITSGKKDKDTLNALTKKLDETITSTGRPQKGKSDDVKKLLDDAGITEEDIKKAEGSNRKEKMKNAMKSKYSKSFSDAALNVLTYGRRGKTPTPKDDTPGFSKKAKIGVGAGLVGAVPGVFALTDSLGNVFRTDEAAEENERSRRAHEKAFPAEVERIRAIILKHLESNPNDKEAQQRLDRLNQLSGAK
tara:strand:+ start:478 stop:1494 length:1017 start_codon:yes stop_codon:yes gene_type:complete